MEQEIWKVCRDTRYDSLGRRHPDGGIYEISDQGRCRKNGVIVEPKFDGSYLFILCWKYRLHILVATLFVPNPDNKPQVDHIDGNKFNNAASNLRLVTPSENMNNEVTKAYMKTLYDKLQNEHSRTLRREKRTGLKWVKKGNECKIVTPEEAKVYVSFGWTYGKIYTKRA